MLLHLVLLTSSCAALAPPLPLWRPEVMPRQHRAVVEAKVGAMPRIGLLAASTGTWGSGHASGGSAFLGHRAPEPCGYGAKVEHCQGS